MRRSNSSSDVLRRRVLSEFKARRSSICRKGKCDHRFPAAEMLFPHKPTKGENKHRPALPAITRDWLLKHHAAAHASTGLDSYVDITTRDSRHPAIVRVQYFVRGGFVRHRSRASSKHLSPSSSGRRARFLEGQKGVALHLQAARVGVGSTKKPTRC
ncbi:hypothetical protein TNCV_4795351 [Trichonephila clavipes]|nr:hypothetical protein TNCV_4795351 [Trichonephila clavipes]